MREDNVTRGQRRSELLRYLCQRFVIGHENLYVIAHLSQFTDRADEIWHRLGRSVPDENAIAFLAQVFGHSAADNAETNYPNVFSNSTSHSACCPRRASIRVPSN